MLTKILCFPRFFWHLKVSWLIDKSLISLFLPLLETEYICPFPAYFQPFLVLIYTPGLPKDNPKWFWHYFCHILLQYPGLKSIRLRQCENCGVLLSVLMPPCAFPRRDPTALLLLLPSAGLCTWSFLSEMQNKTQRTLAFLAFCADDFPFSFASESIICLVSFPLSLKVSMSLLCSIKRA